LPQLISCQATEITPLVVILREIQSSPERASSSAAGRLGRSPSERAPAPRQLGRPRAQAGAGPSQGCAFGPRAPRPRPPEPSGASTWADGGTGRRALPAPGPRTNAAIGAPPGVTRRSGAPPARSRRHRGSPRVLPGTSAPRHSAPPTCSGVCRGSGGAGVTLQPEPCHPSAGADVSRVRRN
jgi:hypothetical protein